MRSIVKVSFCVLLVLIFVVDSHSQGTPILESSAIDHPTFSVQEGLTYESFLNPANEHRSHPFYSLNDQLNAEELRRQILEFKQAGFGGFYLHSRPGLLTDYLSEEWWELMDVAVEAAQEAGIRCLFYDEDKWPSGYAGGAIPELGPDFRAKGLAKIDLQTEIPEGSVLLKKDSQFQYIQYTAQYGYDIFNGTCYVDLFNPNAVKAFIESTHKPYFEKFGQKLKANDLVIFTDEPHIHARYFGQPIKHYGTLSYSNYLEEKFLQLYGYSLRDHVDLLFEEKGNWREVRWHYYMAKALLFEESYTRQIADFCQKYGAQLTGHFLGEDGLSKVRDRIGNSSLHYRSMQQPGIDHLGLSISNRLLTPRYLSSVANQYEKRKRLSELFGITGHNINFQERKWIGGWHAILGVNHFCPHLTAYSIKGARKRDYPPTFSYHQPYWGYNKKIEDYLGRISYAATIGQYDPQVLIISPLESEYLKSSSEGEFTSSTMQIMDGLQEHHIDYDLGDEVIIKDMGKVSGKRFTIGAMAYQCIVLPDMLTIRQSTLSLLLQFHKNGGTLISSGRFPEFINAKANIAALKELEKAVISLPVETWKEKLQQYIPPALKITGAQSDQIWLQSRKVKEDSFYLIYNRSNVSANTVSIQLPSNWKKPLLWDPAQANIYQLSPEQNNTIDLALEPAGFYWITSGEIGENIPVQPLPVPTQSLKQAITIDSPWFGKRTDPNALLLDFASYSTDGGKTYRVPEPVIGIWNRLQEQAYEGNLYLKFFANFKSIPRHCALAIEQPKALQKILVNQKSVSFTDKSYFIDQSIKTQEISKLLKSGQNEIELQIHFSPTDPLSSDPVKRYETELESIYLIGEFGVYSEQIETVDNTQRNQSEDLQKRPAYAFENYYIDQEKNHFAGNVTLEGYPFYAGRFSLNNSFELPRLEKEKQYYLDLSQCEAIAIEVIINDQIVDTLCWAPYLVDISTQLKAGKNTIQLNMVNSLRNLMGPHHHKGVELIKVGPNSFTGAGGFPDGRGEADWYDRRMENKELSIWTDTYYHIPYGLLEKVSILSE